ncbi:MAG: hypothetical protein ACJA1R_003325, partial [Flavobacteriales bacterium]
AEYAQEDGSRLPEAHRNALWTALALVWMTRNLGTPEGVGWADLVRDVRTAIPVVPRALVTDAVERERLVENVRNRGPGWQEHLAQVASFATDVAAERVAQTLRQSPAELTPIALASAIAAGLPVSRVSAAMVEALRSMDLQQLVCCQLARQLPISALAPVAFASLGRNPGAKGMVALELTLAASGSLAELVIGALEHDDPSVRNGATIVASRVLVGGALPICVSRALAVGDKSMTASEMLVAIELFGAQAQRPMAEQWNVMTGTPSSALERVRTLVSRLAERGKS